MNAQPIGNRVFRAHAVAPNGGMVYLTIIARNSYSAVRKAACGCASAVADDGATWRPGTRYKKTVILED